MTATFKTACLMGATLFVKLAHVVAQPMLAPVAWGDSAKGGDTTLNNDEDMTGVTQVSCGWYACAGIKTDGSVVTWGDIGNGGSAPAGLTDVAQVVCGGFACAALKTDRSVVAWGNSNYGGDTGDENMTEMTQVVCGHNACAGLKANGSVVAWGDSNKGGSAPAGLTDVTQVVCGGRACAGLKTDLTVVAWGDSSRGGSAPAGLTDVDQVVCGQYGHACVGLKTDLTVVAWGLSNMGGWTQNKDVNDMTQVACGEHACAGIKTDLSVVAWGDVNNGGSAPVLTDMTQVVCGGRACAGLKANGSVVAWGSSNHGGSAPADLTLTQVVCGGQACAGLKTDGSVVAWGASSKGGSTQGIDVTGMNQVVCGWNACVAWYDTDTAGGGGDPHFIGFGGLYFTWQGHCDLVLVKSTSHVDVDTHFEVHIRTTRVRKWSKIDTIAIKVGQDVGEISSDNGKFILNDHEVNKVQKQSLTVVKTVKNVFSKSGKAIYLYDITLQKDKKLEIEVNTRTCMIYTKLSGNYPQDTEGILGSPHQPGLVTRNRKDISSANVNAFVETWQVRDSDPHLFITNRAPQYPSKCMYDVKKMGSSHRNRRLRELHYITKEEATAACYIHHMGPLQNFCVDDVVMTGDLDTAKDEFYE